MFILVFPFVFVLELISLFAPENWTALICICLSPVPRLTKSEKGRKQEKPLPVDYDREAWIVPSHFKEYQANSMINGSKSKSANTWLYRSFKRRNWSTVRKRNRLFWLSEILVTVIWRNQRWPHLCQLTQICWAVNILCRRRCLVLSTARSRSQLASPWASGLLLPWLSAPTRWSFAWIPIKFLARR